MFSLKDEQVLHLFYLTVQKTGGFSLDFKGRLKIFSSGRGDFEKKIPLKPKLPLYGQNSPIYDILNM